MLLLKRAPSGRGGACGTEESPEPCPEGGVEELMAEWSLSLQNFVTKAHGSPLVYWLGLSDRDREGDWRWLDGSPVTLRQVSRAPGVSAHFGRCAVQARRFSGASGWAGPGSHKAALF